MHGDVLLRALCERKLGYGGCLRRDAEGERILASSGHVTHPLGFLSRGGERDIQTGAWPQITSAKAVDRATTTIHSPRANPSSR